MLAGVPCCELGSGLPGSANVASTKFASNVESLLIEKTIGLQARSGDVISKCKHVVVTSPASSYTWASTSTKNRCLHTCSNDHENVVRYIQDTKHMKSSS